jgi:hypothetical protein
MAGVTRSDFVDAPEVVRAIPQGNGGPVVLPFLSESMTDPDELGEVATVVKRGCEAWL